MSRRMAGLAPLLTLLLTGTPASAGSVAGAFVEKGAGTPLVAVEVVLRRAADSTVVAHAATGADGRFRLDSLRLDRYLLRATLLGHEPFTRRDVVLTGGAADIDLGTNALAVLPIAVSGVNVSTARATAIVAPDRNIYLTKDLPGATSGNATDMLRAVPELDVDIDGHVSLRGSASVTVQFNGRAAPLKGEALATFLRQMPASRVERVEVMANPSAKFDPEGAAGIVNLVLKDDAGLGVSGSVNATAGNSWSGPGARVAWQQGKATLFGGVSGFFGRGNYGYEMARRDLLPGSTSAFSSVSGTDYRNGYGMFDSSIDYALTKRSTLYGTVNGYRSSNETDALSHVATEDSTGGPSSRYDRTETGSSDGNTVSYTLGLQHVVKQGTNERTVELLRSDTDWGSGSHGLQRTLVPSGVGDLLSRQSDASGDHQRSLEIDDTHPLGAKGKVETGYRGLERRSTDSSTLDFVAATGVGATPPGATGDYELRERFHSGYVTLGGTFGRFSLQLGARGEVAHTTFDLRRTARHFDNDYRSLFPSANLAWDLGRGRSVRLSYSRRIERPAAYYLNPDVPSTDSLNRYAGNPHLGAKYTHSVSLEANWNGSRGLLRLSPYFRETTDNWDQVTRVDGAGVATSTWLNASSVRYLGASVTASLRQTGRLGGTASFSVYREHHDAGNLSREFRREATNALANGNVTLKTTKTLDLQGYLRYSPAQTLAQGRSSSFTYLTLGARQKFGEKVSASLWIRDPFSMARWSRSTGDSSYTQTSTNRNRLRGASATVTWTWGKSPEQKPRRQSADSQQQPDAQGQAR